MSVDLENFPLDERYRIFEALSHPLRVKILRLVNEKQLTFSALKRELGLESSGQLQHHLQKLTGFIVTEKGSGCYGLTDVGRRALDIYASSEASGRPLAAVCCLPATLEASKSFQVGRTGSILRLSLAGILLVPTAVFLASYLVSGRPLLLGFYGPSFSIGLGLTGTVIVGFFGVSFLIAALTRHPGCEVTAIPNLFARKNYYCSCLITPFNLPNGRFLERTPEPSGY